MGVGSNPTSDNFFFKYEVIFYFLFFNTINYFLMIFFELDFFNYFNNYNCFNQLPKINFNFSYKNIYNKIIFVDILKHFVLLLTAVCNISILLEKPEGCSSKKFYYTKLFFE